MKTLTRLLDAMEPLAEGDWVLSSADEDQVGADCD